MFSTSYIQCREADLILDAYVRQIRDIAAKQSAAGGTLVNISPDIKKKT